ncbi:MAG: FtsK/SpoIIIE domain-containing protein [Candidatus Acidiferrales bacterium]
MSPDELIGVTAASLINQLALGDEPSGGTARFLLDRLTETQIAAVCGAIALHPVLSADVQMRIPREVGNSVGLPPEILTDERSTFWRNADCPLPILVLANTEDDQGQSLKDVTAIGSNELLSIPMLWVEKVAEGANLPESQIKWWAQALKGLLDARPLSLDAFARYVLLTRTAVDEGLPIIEALGRALPALRAPRDSAYFNGIPKNALGHANRWRRLFQKLFISRAPYLVKIGPNQQPISKETLEDSFKKVQDEIDPQHHELFVAFINSDSNWNETAQLLADLEWEEDKVKSLFDGLRVKAEPLGKATLDFYEDEFPVSLAEEDRDYLQRLDQRRTRETNDEDTSFYEQHRYEVGQNRPLKLKWERFVFGQPLETDDFLVGVLQILERLYEQAGATAEERRLVIECRHSKRDWLEMNFDAVTCFARCYCGLKMLTGDRVEWDVPHLFEFDAVVRDEERKGRYERTDTARRTANQIKFTFRLNVKRTGDESEYTSQLIWTFNPESVLSQYDADWNRLKQNPFTRSRVAREVVSAKGKLQTLDLNDASTMMPVFRQDRGSLVSAYDPEQDISAGFCGALEIAYSQRRITEAGKKALADSWLKFSKEYLVAIESQSGAATETWLQLADSYRALLDALVDHATGDRNRIDLWTPILSIGTTVVDGGASSAIVTPWHPLRMVSAAVKSRQVAGLLRHLLTSETVNFGDARMFFRDLGGELGSTFYPDVCIGMVGTQPTLLSIAQTCGDYSIMESPCRWGDIESATDDDPRSASGIVIRLLRRYLELQPHEEANLTVVLYNCDSAQLPQAVVEQLSNLYEDGNNEVRCQVVLRHSDPRKLNDLYGTLLKISEENSELFVGSEASRDFMSKLRISIMAEQAQVPSEMSGPPTDIVFLYDVIARASELCWVEEDRQHSPVDLLHHVPPRWSKRKPSAKDDLRSTTYLTCPLQPSVGWSYLRAVQQILTGNDNSHHALPARRISFQNNKIREVFDEVHRLGQWVVNYDELLTKRQLRNLGVQVIRYQKLRHEGRNLLISSTAPLNLLNVLVQKQIRKLSLGLSAEELEQLASRMLDVANDISGDIVLRAAKHGCFANELIGLVLSRYLIEDEIGSEHHAGWFFLDDYADWLGQKEEHIADILALSPQFVNGRHRLIGIVGEAKLVASDGVAQARKTSEVQLRETLARIQDAIFGDPGRLDRDLWLGRFADLLLDGMEIPPGDPLRIEDWRDAIREGKVEIVLRGYSHVFVHEENSERLASTRTEVAKVEGAWQETFARDSVRELVLRFWGARSPRDIREALGWAVDDDDAKGVASRVMWAVPVGSGIPSSEQVPGADTPIEDRVIDGRGGLPPVEQSPLHVPDAKVSNPTQSGGEGSTAADNGLFLWATPRLREVLSSLLPTRSGDASGESWLKDTTKRMRSALLNYGLQAKVLDERLTPNAALIRFQGSDRLKVADLESKRSQLLTTHELKVIRISAEPGSVVVTIARPEREIVSLVDVLRTRTVDDQNQHVNQSLVVGIREANGDILYLSPGKRHSPHTLIAGTTGSGKSVLIQNLILDIGMTNSAKAAQITLIDPKQGVDYFALEALPHLAGRLVVEQGAAQALLEQMVVEMDRRYRLFRETRVSSLNDFNARVSADQRLPVLWIVHDEFAEWMLIDEYKEIISSTVQRLGVKARAAGIFLLFAAQRPEDRVMPVQLRDNLGNRLVLRVESEGTSRIALLEEGAERLLGKGHLAARLQGEDDLVIAQVPILATHEIEAIVHALTKEALL